MSGLQTTAENAANIENYEKAQATINKVLKRVESLKESEANAELQRQIQELDEAYENAIRLRMLRIDTLQAHCDDRDAELVVLRRQAIRYSHTKRLTVRAVLAVVVVGVAAALRWLMPEFCATLAAIVWETATHISKSSSGAAAVSCVVTLGVSKALYSGSH